MSRIFPKSANRLPLQIVIFAFIAGGIATAGITYYATPKYTRIGYGPVQPVPFSHAQHVGQLGLDCRYCHSNVETAPVANVPTSQTCMNCHTPGLMPINADNPRLAPVQQSFASGEAVPWVRVHQVPDYVYFNHGVHVSRGVSCVECHGQINEMPVVTHSQPLSMGFCLDCHRNPEPRVRPLDQVFNLEWKPENMADHDTWAAEFVKSNQIVPPQACSGCHR